MEVMLGADVVVVKPVHIAASERALASLGLHLAPARAAAAAAR